MTKWLSLICRSEGEVKAYASEHTETHPGFHYFRSSSTSDWHPSHHLKLYFMKLSTNCIIRIVSKAPNCNSQNRMYNQMPWIEVHQGLQRENAQITRSLKKDSAEKSRIGMTSISHISYFVVATFNTE